VVQPLLVTELVFALVLRWLWLHQSIRPVTWWAAALTCVSLTLFIAMAEPSGGSGLPTSGAWASATAAVAGTATLLALLGQSGPAGRRAAFAGGLGLHAVALVATFIKATTDTLTQFGVSGVFTHWPVHALAVGGLAAELLNQSCPPCRPPQHLAAVHRHRRPYCQHRAECVDLRGDLQPQCRSGSPSARSPLPACASLVTVLARTAPATMDPAS
jgi:hypothetical protein